MAAFGTDARVAIAGRIHRANIGMKKCVETRRETGESMRSYAVMAGQY